MIDGFLQRLDVVEWDMLESGDERFERLTEILPPGRAERPHRASMEAAHRRDDFLPRVEARANLMAASTASEPELLRKTRPRFLGATERSFSTKVAFAVVPNTGPMWMSSRAWAWIASTIAGLQCPRLPTPKDAPQSMYSLPSSSQSVATDPRTNVGPRFGAHPNSIARASGTLTRSPCPSLRAPARPGPAEGTRRSPRAPRRPGGLRPRR